VIRPRRDGKRGKFFWLYEFMQKEASETVPAHVPKYSVVGHPDFESRVCHPQIKI
jgi:hypothetical protein